MAQVNVPYHLEKANEVYGSRTHTHTHTRLTALCPGLPGWAGTRKVKPVWILLKQETVSGSGISWAICKSAPLQTDNHASTSSLSFSTGRMPFLPPNQQRQSTEGNRPTCSVIMMTTTTANLSLQQTRDLNPWQTDIQTDRQTHSHS